jgi:hypothetical protein
MVIPTSTQVAGKLCRGRGEQSTRLVVDESGCQSTKAMGRELRAMADRWRVERDKRGRDHS